MRSAVPSLVILCGFVVGCGVTVNYHRLNAAPTDMDPREPEEVAVFTTREPPYPYVDVAMLEVRQESLFSGASEKAVFRALRKAAGRHGCDGIILMGSADAVQSFSSGNGQSGGGFTGTLHGYRATCIARIPQPRRPPSPPVAASKPAPPPAGYVDPFAEGAGDGVSGAADACHPACSPGYACRDGSCVPTCDPPCGPGEVCGADRSCRHP
jgi:hypothetical protein